MDDVNCPYCGKDLEVCHDDGYGCEEDELYEYECTCGKNFVFHVCISFNYSPYKAPCLNGEPHKYEKVSRVPRVINGCEVYRCKWCNEEEDRLSECSKECREVGYNACIDCSREVVNV